MNSSAYEVARKIRTSEEWNAKLCEELCSLAGMSEEWDAADGESFEEVVYAAAEKLGVEI